VLAVGPEQVVAEVGVARALEVGEGVDLVGEALRRQRARASAPVATDGAERAVVGAAAPGVDGGQTLALARDRLVLAEGRQELPGAGGEDAEVLDQVAVRLPPHGALRVAPGDARHAGEVAARCEARQELGQRALGLTAHGGVDPREALEDERVRAGQPGAAEQQRRLRRQLAQPARDRQRRGQGRAHDGETDDVEVAAPQQQPRRALDQQVAGGEAPLHAAQGQVLQLDVDPAPQELAPQAQQPRRRHRVAEGVPERSLRQQEPHGGHDPHRAAPSPGRAAG
jgi:hypothetical protein